jgi:DNA-binding IclR family transcriptional regulator
MTIEENNFKKNYIVSSLVRGLKILTTFTVERPSLKVSEVAEITGLDQATVFRFMYTLEYLGYLVRDEDTKRYHLGVKMLALSLPARASIAVRGAALPTMLELSQKINETVKLAVLDGIETVMVAIVEVLDKLNYSTPIGHRLPAFCTAQGKIMIAYQPVDNWDKLISKINFVSHTQNTIIDPQRFREELLMVRRQGYAISDEEMVLGLGAVAAPVFNHSGEVAAAINISGLSSQILHSENTDYFIEELMKSAQVISAKLNYIPELR